METTSVTSNNLKTLKMSNWWGKLFRNSMGIMIYESTHKAATHSRNFHPFAFFKTPKIIANEVNQNSFKRNFYENSWNGNRIREKRLESFIFMTFSPIKLSNLSEPFIKPPLLKRYLALLCHFKEQSWAEGRKSFSASDDCRVETQDVFLEVYVVFINLIYLWSFPTTTTVPCTPLLHKTLKECHHNPALDKTFSFRLQTNLN